MTLTGQELVAAVSAFAATISEQPLGLAHHCPPEDAGSDCVKNVESFIEQHGGTARYGWCFHVGTVSDQGSYLIASHHAVWHNPEDGHLVNLTPHVSDSDAVPVTHQEELLFLVDDAALPVGEGDDRRMLQRQYHAVTDNEAVQSRIAELEGQQSSS